MRAHIKVSNPSKFDRADAYECILTAANKVWQQLDNPGIQQAQLGGRQHYLRWKTPDTAIAWDAAGLDYDSTLAFADRGGFRCGVCYEFPMYDLKNRRPLNLLQRPSSSWNAPLSTNAT